MSRTKLPRLVWLLGLTSFFTDVSSEMIVSLLPAFLVGTLQAPGVVVGVVDGVADAVSAVIKLFAGRLSDRLPRRRPLVLFGYGLSTIARPLVSFASAPWHAVAVRALDRVGKGFRSAPRDALLAESMVDAGADDIARAFGVHRAMDHAGAVVGPLVGSALLAAGLAMPDVFRAAWGPGALALVALLLVREPPRAPTTTPTTATHADGDVPRPSRAILVPFAIAAAGFAVEPFLLLAARAHGAADATLPLYWLVMHVAKSTAAAWGPRPSTARTRAFVLAGALSLSAAGALLTGFGSTWIDVLAVVVVGLGAGGREPLERARVDAWKQKGGGRGAAFGAFHLATGLATLPGGLVVGACFDYAPGPTGALLGVAAAAALLVVAAIGVVIVDGRRS
jgi:hypothetical protein